MRALAAALLLVLASCGGDPVSPDRAAYDVAIQQWVAIKPANGTYAMVQRVLCFCPFGATAYRVAVTGGIITQVTEAGSGTPVSSAEFSRFRTIDQLFAEIRDALAVKGRLRQAAYDPAQGYPVSVSLDPIQNAVDDEVQYVTDGLTLSR